MPIRVRHYSLGSENSGSERIMAGQTFLFPSKFAIAC